MQSYPLFIYCVTLIKALGEQFEIYGYSPTILAKNYAIAYCMVRYGRNMSIVCIDIMDL